VHSGSVPVAPGTTAQWDQGEGNATMATSICERCGGSLVSITFDVDGEPRTMRSCSACDHRTWLAGAERIDLDGVLSEIPDVRRAAAGR
jgi:hypothetical protein